MTAMDFYREIDFHVDVPHEIKSYMDAETLLGFAAVYGDDGWAIDVSCEEKSSYIVIIEIATGITYTFLNVQYSGLFEHYKLTHNIFTCAMRILVRRRNIFLWNLTIMTSGLTCYRVYGEFTGTEDL